MMINGLQGKEHLHTIRQLKRPKNKIADAVLTVQDKGSRESEALTDEISGLSLDKGTPLPGYVAQSNTN